MNRRLLYTLLLAILGTHSQAQVLGTPKTFDFVLSPVSARTNALAGSQITVKDGDISLAMANPALLSNKTKGEFALSNTFHFAGINTGSVSYGWNLDSLGIAMHGGVQYITYGSFDLTDNFDNTLGTFSASEVAVFAGASKQINDRISVGANLRWLSANYEQYSSAALGIDLGALYSNADNTFAVGAVVRNAGLVLNQFADTKEKVRNDIQIAFSKRLQHLPFRYTVTLHQLQQWNLRYADPVNVQTDILGNAESDNPLANKIDNLFRHLLFSGEFLLGSREQMRLRVGYNHLRNQELSVLTFRNLTGFSLGFGFNVKRFKLDYGVAYYHLQGATNQLSIRFNPFEYNKA